MLLLFLVIAMLLSKAIHGSLHLHDHFLMDIYKYRRDWFISLACIFGLIDHLFLELDLREHHGF